MVVVVLPINKLDRSHHEIAVWANTMSKDGGEAVSMMALVVIILAERDRGAAHLAVIVSGSWIVQLEKKPSNNAALHSRRRQPPSSDLP